MAHYLDIITALLGLLYILLEVRASVWMWAVGAIMQTLGIVLYYDKGLYADCGMEFYYLGMTLYGFAHWRRHLDDAATASADAVRPTTFWQRPLVKDAPLTIACLTLTVATVWAIIYWLLITFTDSTVPAADALTTALSMVGIYLLARRYVEQWVVWIVVDAITCLLYFHKGIPFKATLYGLYVVIAVVGLARWRRKLRQAQ